MMSTTMLSISVLGGSRPSPARCSACILGWWVALATSASASAGALAPWLWPGARITRGHLRVPPLGHHRSRRSLPSTGSGAAVHQFVCAHPEAARTLGLCDLAIAARHLRQPMHLALALFDLVVPPPGQFAIHNTIPGDQQHSILPEGR